MDQVNKIIDNLADKLGVTVNSIYPTLLKQARIQGTKDIIVCIISILFTIGCFIFSMFVQ